MKSLSHLSAIAALTLVGSLGTSAFAELRISEICPRPSSLDPNGREAGWIELWNDGSEPVDLGGYELVRVNRGKALAPKGEFLASRIVPAGGYTVVYTSEEYDNASSGDVTVYDNDVMVCPFKVSPKKYPLVALYKGTELQEQFIVPVDLPDNQSIAPAGGVFGNYSGETSASTQPIAVDAQPIDITGKLAVDTGSGVTVTDGVYDYSAVTVQKQGLKADASLTATLASLDTWSVQFSFKLKTNTAGQGGFPLFFCRTSASTPKSGIVVYVNKEGLVRTELRNSDSSKNQTLDADSEKDWFDGQWHTLAMTVSGNCASRFALSIDGETFVDSSADFAATIRSDIATCFGHALDSTYWDRFDGAIKDISFYSGTLIGREVIVGSVDPTAKVSISAPASVSRVILKTITKGAANNRTAESAYGPNAGPLFGVAHSFSDHEPHAPAALNEPYDVTLAVNPMSDAEGDAIQGVRLLYRVDFGTISSVMMTKGGYEEGKGQLWTAQIPASAITQAGHLLRWAAQIGDAAGNVWRTPSFRNPDDGYEWYGTLIEPTTDQTSATLQTWHMFGDSTAISKMDSQYDNIRGSLPLGARVGIYDSQTSNYYDNVRIDLRGNTTANMSKKSHGLRFSKAHPMTCVNPFTGEKISCRKTSLIAELTDVSRVRSSLSMYLRRLGGQDVPFGYPVRVQLNGAFYQLDHHTNRFTDELLEDYFGYDPYGYAWKNVGTVGGSNTSGGMSQILPDDGTSVSSTYNAFQSALTKAGSYTPTATGLSGSDWTNLNRNVVKLYDLPEWINFLALARLTQECDDGWANLCLYYDRLGNGTWRPLAYDLHQSLGAYYASDNYTSPARKGLWATEDDAGKCHPFYGGCHVVTAHFRSNLGYGNRAIEAVYQNEKYRRLHNRRLRTLMDQILKEPGTSKADTPFWNDFVEPMVAAMLADDVLDRKKWAINTGATIYVWPKLLTFEEGVQDLWDNYFVRRRTHFFDTHSVTNTAFAGGYANNKNAQIPLAQSPIADLKANFSVTEIDGGVVVRNLNAETVDMSGWKLSGPMKYTFPAGTVIDQAFGATPGEVFVVSNRIAYVAANESRLTEQVIVGNAKAGTGESYGLKDADGEIVIGTPDVPTPGPLPLVFSGDYNEPVVIDVEGSYSFENAHLNAGLVISDGITVKIKAAAETSNTISSIAAAGAEVRFTGDGTVKLEGADTLATVSNLVVKSGVLEIKSTGVSATKTPVVNVLGFVEQTGGVIDMDLDVATTNQIYGIYVANKDLKNELDEYLGVVYALFDGGTFNATVGAGKSSAVYINKGSVLATFKGGHVIDAVLKGTEPRFISASGDVEFKRCEATVTMASPADTVFGARVFKSDKKITITDGLYVVNVPGPDAEVFSSADRITIDGGTFELVASDDCFSAKNRIKVNGGLFYAVSLENDVFDSNGDMEIAGGTILAFATAEGHEAFDVDPEQTEEGSYAHQLRINGGTIFATGGKTADWPDDLVTADGLTLFADEDLDASSYSGKYLSLRSAIDVVTTARLPEFTQSKCAVLATCPGMTGTPALSATAPAEGSQDFHDLYVFSAVQTNQDQLRFLEIFGSTNLGDVEDGTFGDVGEYIVITNISDRTVQLAGVEVFSAKNDVKKGQIVDPKCLIALTEGTLPAYGSLRLNQEAYTGNGWTKITNGNIYLKISDATGTVIQSGYASFDNEKYPCVDGEGGALVAIRFDTTLEDTTEFWKSSIVPHDHVWGEAVYAWSEDHATCTASAVCGYADCTHATNETATAVYAVTKPATTEEEGSAAYTASFEGEMFATQTFAVVLPKKPTPSETEISPISGDAAGTRGLIQAAIDEAAAESPAGTVTLAEGLFEIDSQLMVTGGVTLVGAGWDKTLVKQTVNGNRVMTLDGGAKVERLTVTGGNAFVSGAGALVLNGTISWCCISNNVSTLNSNPAGGGVSFAGGQGQIDHSIVIGNKGSTNCYGGGIGATSGSGSSIAGPVLIDTCLVVGNSCSGCAGGIGFKNADYGVTVRNCTVVGNSASASHTGGIRFESGSGNPTLVNTIVVGNLLSGAESNYAAHRTLTADSKNCFLGRATEAANIPNSLSGDAEFVDAASGDYRLSADSPAVGSGAAFAEPGVDLDGEAFGARPSIGCYEFAGTDGVRPPAFGSVSVSAKSHSAVISGAIASVGNAGATACDVYLAVNGGEAVKIAAGVQETFSYAISGLVAETTYAYVLSLTNNAVNVLGAETSGSFTTTAASASAFAKRIAFTVNGTAGAGLQSIPVLVRLSESIPGFFYDDCEPENLSFQDVGEQVLPHEIDTWNVSGESLVWVNVPTPEQGTTFYLYYDGEREEQNNPTDVWVDYTGVWHLNEATAAVVDNSIGTYANSTATTGIDGHVAEKSVVGVTGRIGKCFRVNDSTGAKAGNFNYGGVWVNDAGANSPVDGGQNFTISGWFKHDSFAYYWDHFFYKRSASNNSGSPNNAFAIESNSGSGTNPQIYPRGSSGSGSVALNENNGIIGRWDYITFVYDVATCSVYQNGKLTGTATITACVDNDSPLVFGNNCNIASGLMGDAAWNGWIDEVRYSKGSKSAAWIAAEYAAMASDDFLSVGAVEDIGGPGVAAPVISPASGQEFCPTLSVTIACATDGATIRYTLDGTKPTETSAVYTGAIVLTETTTIKACAFKEGLRPSGVVMATYTYWDPNAGLRPVEGDPAATRKTIQDAIDAAAAETPVGTVLLNSALFEIDSQLMVTNGVVLMGQGWSNTIITQVTAAASTEVRCRCATVDGGSKISGMTLTGGYLPEDATEYGDNKGAGVKVLNGQLSFCRIVGNRSVAKRGAGGGVYINQGTIDHCEIANNSCSTTFGDGAGGILIKDQTGPVLIDACLVVGNRAACYSNYQGGGGITAPVGNIHQPVTIRNTTIANNEAVNGNGGGLSYHQYAWNNSGDLTLINVIITDNVSGSGTDPNVYYSNTPVGTLEIIAAQSSNNIFGNGTAALGTGSVSLAGSGDALFVDAANGDYHLSANSSAIGAGVAYAGIGVDLDKKAFATVPAVGCYEYGETPSDTWDVPGGTGGINGLDDGTGRKYVKFTSITLVDGKLTLGLEAAKVDADGASFLLLCKENLTDDTTFPLQVTLRNGLEETLGTIEGLTDKPQLFIVGIAPVQ